MTTEKEVYDALIGVGFNRSQAAGIMGNLQNESGFNPEALNPGGPTAGVGLAQWETTYYPAAAGYRTGNPARDLAVQVKAIASEAKHLNLTGSAGQVAGTWAADFERCAGCQPGGAQYNARVANALRIYQQAKTGRWPSSPGGGISGSGGGGSGGSAGGGSGAATPAQLTSFLSTPTGVLADAGALLHGTSVLLDRVFGMFAPGQGWRIVFGATAAVSGYGSYHAFNHGGDDGDGNLPLAILLAGVASVALFMMARPWPQTAAGPIKPGAYVVDVLEGQPPPAGPQAFTADEVHLTEAGLAALLGLWAAGKVGQSLGGIAAGAGVAGGLIGKIGSFIKGLGGEAAAGAEAGAALPVEGL